MAKRLYCLICGRSFPFTKTGIREKLAHATLAHAAEVPHA